MYDGVAQYRWFCHFDDDVYVNVRELVSVLDRHSPSSEPVYLGRWPLSREKMEVCILYIHGVIILLYHIVPLWQTLARFLIWPIDDFVENHQT